MQARKLLAAAVLSLTVIPFLSPSAARAAPDCLEAWLPDDVIGYVKVQDLGEHVDRFLASDFFRELKSAYQAYSTNEGIAGAERKIREGLDQFRTTTGKDFPDVVRALLGREAVLGLRLGIMGPELILIGRSAGNEQIDESLAALRKAFEQQKGYPVQAASSSYGSRTIETVDNACYAKLDGVLAMSNSRRAVENVIDLSAGKSSASVKASAAFAKAAATIPAGALAQLVVRPQSLPDFRIQERANDALGSLLVGGWLGALGASEWITMALVPEASEMDLVMSSILGTRAKDEQYWKKFRAFFPETPADDVIDRLQQRGILAAMRLQRDLVQWWEDRESLIPSAEQYGLYQFAQILSMAFGGLDFQKDILPTVGKTLTVVARNQEYPGSGEKPRPEIPGFAAIFEVEKSDEAKRRIVTAFQTVVSFANMDRSQSGKGQGELKVEKVGDVEMHVLRLPATGPDADASRNFSPSVAVVGSRFILGSSAEITKLLVEEVGKESAAAQSTACAPESMMFDAGALKAILSTNRELLIADNMAKKGHSREQAEGEVKFVLDALAFFRNLRVSSSKEGDTVKLRAELGTRWSIDPGAKS